ncbi:MAG: 50S ribosomal protein L9 [Fidelibacterota bacterium]
MSRRGWTGEVILREAVKGLGEAGDIVQVKPGYARNYLIPRGLAVPATGGNLRAAEDEKKKREIRERKEAEEARELAKKLQKVELTAPVQVGEEDRVFGSVTAMTIAQLLKEKGFRVERKDVLLEEPIKALGVYTVPVKLHADVKGEVKVYVIKSQE